MTRINFEQANTICETALRKARELALKPVCVAVLDPGGHVVALMREDGASNLRPQIALAKASGALGVGVSSRKIAEMAVERPTFVAALAQMAPHGLIPAAGGVLVADDLGHSLGAVGVTGDTSDNDELCALAGIAAAGLAAQA